MSKIGKQKIIVPEGIEVKIDGGFVIVRKDKNELKVPVLHGVDVVYDETKRELTFSMTNSTKQNKSNWGTTRALVANAVLGLMKGFEKTLILEGVGYRVMKSGENLEMNLGFSHPVRYAAVPGIQFEVEKNTILKIKGFDKELVGRVAAEIRALKKPEPYKGKGFRYSDEVIRRKAGKKAAATASAS
ncbi:MAG TPA: 50S ribosomal protein L6 [Candidatus Paceibacterota bacterium]|nr:50S ribosomal protein L6 [Candidatus Paceibacterota bacterium]